MVLSNMILVTCLSLDLGGGGLGLTQCSPGCPGSCSVDQASLAFRAAPAFASLALGLILCTTQLPAW